MSDRRRLDQILVDRGLAPSRTKAQELITAGQVTVTTAGRDLKNLKPSFEVPPEAEIHCASGPADRYVSRGGLKLEGALASTGLDVRGRFALDVGQSTGGFSDCLLQHGIARVVGIDVGHGQIHPRLKADPRVVVVEGVHGKDLESHDSTLRAALEGRSPDLVVADLSFISVTAVLGPMVRVAAPGAILLALVKPQFEVGPEGLGKGGIVRDPLLYGTVESKIRESAEAVGWKKLSYFKSPIEGKDGNREFFLHAQKTS